MVFVSGMMKRAFDVCFVLFLLFVLSPLFLSISILIFVLEGRPIVFKQKRAGKNGRIFKVYKFRTMLKDMKNDRGAVVDNRTDRRVTRLGRILRSNNLDEIPQLINILKGDLSFVGPRPDPDYEFREFSSKIPEWKQRVSVKPGLTGWAQINGKNNRDPRGTLEHDLYYLKNKGFLFDLKILLKTPGFSIRNTLL